MSFPRRRESSHRAGALSPAGDLGDTPKAPVTASPPQAGAAISWSTKHRGLVAPPSPVIPGDCFAALAKTGWITGRLLRRPPKADSSQ